MKCKNRTEVKNKLSNYKYLKIRFKIALDLKEMDEAKKIKREMKKIERVIEKVTLQKGTPYGNILTAFYIDDIPLVEYAKMYNISYDYIKHLKINAITYIVDNQLL